MTHTYIKKDLVHEKLLFLSHYNYFYKAQQPWHFSHEIQIFLKIPHHCPSHVLRVSFAI